MRMTTETEPLGNDPERVRYSVRFTEWGQGMPDVTLVFERTTFDRGSIDSGVQRVTIDGSMIDASKVAKVAEQLPRLVAHAYAEAAPGVPSVVQADMVSLAAGAADRGIPAEVAKAAAIYRQAVEEDRLPLQAVMKALSLSKPTASRRVRAAKDLGLIPDSKGGK